MEAQRSRLREECDRRDWNPIFVEEIQSAKDMERPMLQSILTNIRKGDILISAKLDRLSRSVYDFSSLMAQSTRDEWEIVLLEPSVDTMTPHGKFTANIFAAVAELERELISQRTKEALAVLKAQGKILGAPKQIPDDIEERIVAERANGFTLREIAEGLTLDDIPTATGANQWAVSTIVRVLNRAVSQ
jgi:DNA invertase Pin-like site-specific DNA recombinase